MTKPSLILQDLIEDPKNNGDYKLAIEGEELRRLWLAIEQLETQLAETQTDKTHFAQQVQELAEILTGQPGTVAHFRSVRETAQSLVANQAS